MIGQLLPVMMKSDSDDVRIVLVSAGLHRMPWLYDINQINYSGDPNAYSMLTSYSRSKLYQVFYLLSNVTFLVEYNYFVYVFVYLSLVGRQQSVHAKTRSIPYGDC